MKSTQAMRDRIRELSTISDDYDRAVLCVLDDLEALPLSEKRVTILPQEYTDEDMAVVGRAFMEAIEQARQSDPWVKDWAPAQCPSEIIFDLLNRSDDQVVRLHAALKRIEDLALKDESPSYKWGAAFQIVTNVLHR